MRANLDGVRVVVTRAAQDAEALAGPLRGYGATVVLAPLIEFVAPENEALLSQVLAEVPGPYTGVLFTSAKAVSCCFDSASSLDLSGLIVGAAGQATADALTARGVRDVVVPDEYHSEGLLVALDRQFGTDMAGSRWLLPRARKAREVLPQGLRARGAHVDVVVAYRTVPCRDAGPLVDALRDGVDVITFASGSAVEAFFGLIGDGAVDALQNARVASIGPVTTAACADHGLAVDFQPLRARMHELAAVIDADWKS